MDGNSFVRMDILSEITIIRATATLLAIELESGRALIVVQYPDPDYLLEIEVGNIMLSVIGTLFVVEHGADGWVHVTMLEGEVKTDSTRILQTGIVTRIYDDTVERVYNEHSIILEELDNFILQAVWDYQNRLLEAGAFTSEMLEVVANLLGLVDIIYENELYEDDDLLYVEQYNGEDLELTEPDPELWREAYGDRLIGLLLHGIVSEMDGWFLYDIDMDGVPELVIITDGGHRIFRIYTFVGNEIVEFSGTFTGEMVSAQHITESSIYEILGVAR